MGAGLAFLNKKSWHTGGMKQIEQVWKREQEHAKEQARVAELQKQIQEERQVRDIQRLAEDNRHQQKKNERLDFMYNTPLANRAELEQSNAFLLGEKKVDLVKEEKKEEQLEKVVRLPSAYTDDTPQSRNEVWLRLNNDPLFAIKRQQQTALASIKKNPVKMEAIKQEVKEMKSRSRHSSSGQHSSRRRHKHRRRHHKYKTSYSRSLSRSRSRSPKYSRRSTRNDKYEYSGRHEESHLSQAHNDRHGKEPRPRDTQSEAHSNTGKYGLNASSQAEGTSTRGRFSAQEKIEEMKKREIIEREQNANRNKAWSYGGRKKHEVGKMTEDEKNARLAEMISSAKEQGESRLRQVRKSEQDDREELQREGESKGSTFLDTFQKNVYGANKVDCSLGEAVGRRKFYSERQGQSSSNAFRK